MANTQDKDVSIHLLARHYLSYLHTHSSKENEVELLTVINFINELITADELKQS